MCTPSRHWILFLLLGLFITAKSTAASQTATSADVYEFNDAHFHLTNYVQEGTSHVIFDISWDEVAKYLVASTASLKVTADLINQYPDRFLFGTDSVASKSQTEYQKTYHPYDPLWASLTPETGLRVRKGNYERMFDEARKRVRAREAKQVRTLPQAATAAL